MTECWSESDKNFYCCICLFLLTAVRHAKYGRICIACHMEEMNVVILCCVGFRV